MKVYFVASIRGKSQFLENYKSIVGALRAGGLEVIENILKPTEKEVYALTDGGKIEYYKRVLKWISQADIVVAEASFSSLGVGYEISLALEKNKPVIVLYEEGQATHFLGGIQSDRLSLVKYTLVKLPSILKQAFEHSSAQMETRFNFFVPRRLVVYLDWISKNKRIPRAVYLRQLIRREMQRNRDFQS